MLGKRFLLSLAQLDHTLGRQLLSMQEAEDLLGHQRCTLPQQGKYTVLQKVYVICGLFWILVSILGE